MSHLLRALLILIALVAPLAAQQVVGVSAVWVSGGVVQTYSTTDIDYLANAYYDAYTEGYLFQDSMLIRSGSAHSGSTARADGYMDAPGVPDAPYQLETDHYLMAFVAYYDAGTAYYSNPYGFGFISSGDPYGSPSGTVFVPVGSAVYVTTQALYLGTTIVGLLNVPSTPTYAGPSDLSYLNEADALSFISRQEREQRVRNWDVAIVAAIAANEARKQQDRNTFTRPI